MNLTKLILLVAVATLGYYSVVYLYWNKDFDLVTGTLFTIMTVSYAVPVSYTHLRAHETG
jgi:hypothetical protein